MFSKLPASIEKMKFVNFQKKKVFKFEFIKSLVKNCVFEDTVFLTLLMVFWMRYQSS